MDNKVKKAISAALNKYATVEGIALANLEQELLSVFESDASFLDKVGAYDAVFDNHPKFEALREVLFDMLMINFFSADVQKLEEDYLDSEEWLKIEDDTIDRGTELLNLLLYIKECQDEQIAPELGDFLKEFLLVEEDEFQDEFSIYESVISSQNLAEASVAEICAHQQELSDEDDMKELYVPFMVFFSNPKYSDESLKELIQHSENKAFDVATYALIANFNS